MSPIDLQEVKAHLFYSLAVPIPCLLIAIFYLVIAYKFIYNDDKDKHVSLPILVLTRISFKDSRKGSGKKRIYVRILLFYPV